MNSEIDITRIVNASILQSFPDAFYKATGFACGLHNLSGDLITAIPKNNYCDFCRNMFFSSKGHPKCVCSNKTGQTKAFDMNQPYIYTCHAGLTDVSAPIIVKDKQIGSISFGQLIIDNRDDALRESVHEKISGFPATFVAKQMVALERVPVIPRKQVEGLAQLLSLIATNIVMLIISNLEEKAQNIKSVKIINEMQANWTFEKELRQAQIQLKEMELKVLQAQINPHFLYNTLDTIKWLAVLHGEDDIKHIVVALGDLLRYSLEQYHDIVPLSKELEKVESYLMIQKFRYDDKLSYSIDIDEGVLNYKIPKLILQPLVENALKHGLEPKATKGKISISGWTEEDGSAVIEIKDDGVGMDTKTFNEICASLYAPEDEQRELFRSNGHGSIGLENVNKRLMYTFGEDCGLRVLSKKDVGTIIRFRIKQII